MKAKKWMYQAVMDEVLSKQSNTALLIEGQALVEKLSEFYALGKDD